MGKKAKKAYTHMSQCEIGLAAGWQKEGQTPNHIAKLLKRDPKTVRKNIAKTQPGAMKAMKVGRPPMPEKDYLKCVQALVILQKQAKGLKEVTAAMVKAKAGVDYCEKVIRAAFAKHGKPFRKLREKPLLKPEDVLERKEFTTTHAGKRRRQWLVKPRAIIDNKKFPLYLDIQGRRYAARRSVRGAYRTGGQAVESHLVKPKSTLKYPAKGVMVTAAVIKGRVRFWHVTNGRWNAGKAVQMYVALHKVLKKVYPKDTKWQVLEDNDPAGYKATAAVNKKDELGIDVLALPPRSPDLNVLDYSIWAEISKRMRQQETQFPANKKESKEAFLKRLRATALGLPSSFVEASVMSMHRRCAQIKAAKGFLIEE